LFGEVSMSQIGLERAGLQHPAGRQIYGPGVQFGYEYVARGGLTMALSGGLGYGIDVRDHANPWKPMLGLSCGYTWRSQRSLHLAGAD
jgi:hypothetical protein